MLKTKCESKGDIPKALEELQRSVGIELSDKLSILHINESLINLQSITTNNEKNSNTPRNVINFEDKYAQALMGLALKVKTRKY